MGGPGGDPGREAALADSVSGTLLAALDNLEPVERLAFVLHEVFAVPIEEVGSIIGRSPAATRRLTRRARRRVRAGRDSA